MNKKELIIDLMIKENNKSTVGDYSRYMERNFNNSMATITIAASIREHFGFNNV